MKGKKVFAWRLWVSALRHSLDGVNLPQQGSGDGGFALSFKNNLLCKSRQYPCLSLLCLHYTSGAAASAWCLAEQDPCVIRRN